MATREENIQKINEQLEQMSDDELEKVTGGYSHELDQNYEALKKMGLVHGYTDVPNFPGRAKDAVTTDGFIKADVGYIHNFNSPDDYFYNNHPISQEQALQLAKDYAIKNNLMQE